MTSKTVKYSNSLIPLINIFFLFLLTGITFGCSSDDEPKEKSRTIDMWVSSTTSYISNWEGEREECMLVKFSENEDWQHMAMGRIEGFEYEKGYGYKLKVQETILSLTPMDGYDRIYKLVEILDKVWEGEVAQDNLQRYYIVGNEGDEVKIVFAPRDKDEFKVDLDCSWARDISYDKTPGKWTVTFKVAQNKGLGRASTFQVTLGEEHYTVGLWQQPREFAETETFENCTGRLCILLGSDLENLKRLHNFIFKGGLNADDLGWLKAWLLEAWEGPQTKGFLTFDFSDCPLSMSEASENPKYNLPELPDYYKVDMESDNALPSRYFKDLQGVKSVILYNGLITIGESAFDHCSFLESVNLPSELRKIGSNAFSGCSSLSEIIFPYDKDKGYMANNHLETIGNNAFMGIGEVKFFIVPESLRSVGNTSLPLRITNLYLMSPTPQQCLENTIVPQAEECTVFIPKGSRDAYLKSAKWSKYSLEEMSEDGLQEL